MIVIYVYSANNAYTSVFSPSKVVHLVNRVLHSVAQIHPVDTVGRESM